MRLFICFFGLFSLNLIPKEADHTFVSDWDSYRIELTVKMPISALSFAKSTTQAREIIVEELRKGMSYYIENLLYDQNLQIKDILLQNPTFSQEYSYYLAKEVNLQLFHQEKDYYVGSAQLPMRGPKGLYALLPLPWKKHNYSALKEAEYVGEAYLVKKVQAEYIDPSGEAYTGLIVDVRKLPFKPSFAPRIFSQEGRLIYGPEFLNAPTGKERGVAGYYYSKDHPELERRVGKKPFYVLPLSVFGKNQTNVVLAEEDVKEIFGHPTTLKNLRKARVVFIMERK